MYRIQARFLTVAAFGIVLLLATGIVSASPGTTESGSHDGLPVSGDPPPIHVDVPNGGETWAQGSTHKIIWNFTPAAGGWVKVELLRLSAKTPLVLTANTSIYTPGGGAGYIWKIPYNFLVGTGNRIRVTSLANPAYTDMSDAYFTVSPGTPLTVLSPNGSEIWRQGTAHTIRWSYTGSTGPRVRIELLGPQSRIISPNVSIGFGGAGSLGWTVPYNQAPGTQLYTLRITSLFNASHRDYSDRNFTVSTGIPLTVTSPNGGEIWTKGSTRTIRWNYTGSPGLYVRIVLLKGGIVNRYISNGTFTGSGGSGWRNWTIPADQAAGTDYRIRISSTSLLKYSDQSNANFSIRIAKF